MLAAVHAGEAGGHPRRVGDPVQIDLTAADLDDWSRRLDARANLPTLVRRLILATVNPEQIVIPAAEAIDQPGLDGIVVAHTSTSPYVPAGRSAWEFGSGADAARKASSDYLKRTRQLSDAERASTTIVVVTSRIWDTNTRNAWVRRRATKHGWAGVVALTAEDLATWLPTCPGVLSWLEGHLGRNFEGSTSLRDWWHGWANQTIPAIPPAVLAAGRAQQVNELISQLSSSPAEQVVATRTEDEAIAFVAASLLVDPLAPEDADLDDEARSRAEQAAQTERSKREALIERTLVVNDSGAWRSRILHHTGLILIPTTQCIDPPLDAAVNRGHHVVLPRVAGASEPALNPLHRGAATDAWRATGQAFEAADALAKGARRSLTSLRRRYGRTGRMNGPEWATGAEASVLAPLLLLNGWNLTFEGDARIVLEMLDRDRVRSVSRELGILAAAEDPPVLHRGDVCEFVDPIDAWDALFGAVTAPDLDLFQQRSLEILRYQDPSRLLKSAERLVASISGTLQPPLYSGTIRRGVATTLALLGAVLGDKVLAGGDTGSDRAARTVHDLLDGATAERWLDLADLLPMLAEAAPSVFVRAIEDELRQDEPDIMALFNEGDGELGLGSSSSHTSLLWALEALAFSPQYVSRVAVILAQFAERDPGGKLANRPKNSLKDVLHPVIPQGAVDKARRLDAIDAVRSAAPEASFDLLLALIGALNDGMILHNRTRFREWPRPPRSTQTNVVDTVSAVAERLTIDAGVAPGRWPKAIKCVTRILPQQREEMLNALAAAWSGLPEAEQVEVASIVRKDISRHSKFRDSAWAIDDAGLARLQAFADVHAIDDPTEGPQLLFTWFPDVLTGVDPHSDEAQAHVRRARRETVDGMSLADIAELAVAAQLPGLVGVAAADAGRSDEPALLEWLASPQAPLRDVATSFSRARQAASAEWLPAAVESNPQLTVDLLLTATIDDDLIASVDELDEEQSAAFWASAAPDWVAAPAGVDAAERLLAVDRPYSAITTLIREDGSDFPVGLGLAIMERVMAGTAEDPSALDMAYELARMLDRLEAVGADDEALAKIEWFLNPVLHHERVTRAFYRVLAREPRQFAELIALTGYPDDLGEEGGVEKGGDNLDAARENAFTILYEWTLPIPGMVGTDHPEAEAVQAWVSAARLALAELHRSHAGAEGIGRALSGPVFDADGTWPCEAVRAVLQHENDARIEAGLFTGRMNSRGVTSRGLYSGGAQERTLAGQYGEWADRVRDLWPRAGAVLDDLASSLESQARREDSSASVYGDR